MEGCKVEGVLDWLEDGGDLVGGEGVCVGGGGGVCGVLWWGGCVSLCVGDSKVGGAIKKV